MHGAMELGSQRPDQKDQKLAVYYNFAAKSRSGKAIYYDFVTEISQRPRYSEWGSQRPQGFFHACNCDNKKGERIKALYYIFPPFH